MIVSAVVAIKLDVDCMFYDKHTMLNFIKTIPYAMMLYILFQNMPYRCLLCGIIAC